MITKQTPKSMLLLMKCLIVFFSLFFVQLLAAQTEDSGIKMPRDDFYSVISLMEQKFSYLAAQDGRQLQIFADYDDDWAQSFARRWQTDQVLIYGGMAKIRGMNEDSLILLICHELGHLYGGFPFKDEYNHLSAEGQADYWATKECFPKVITESNVERGLSAALILTAFFAEKRHLPLPTEETPDLSVVTETMLEHPSPQCRLDTFIAGALNHPRPACWYFER
jgi:hypothetical protein